MNKLFSICLVIFTAFLWGETLFEVKDASNNKVLDVSTDGIRVMNQGDTLMVISSGEIKAFIDDAKGLSRSFSVSTTTSKKGQKKVFEIETGVGSTFFNPDDNTDEIFSISKGSITANVNPTLNRDFEINDHVSGKGSGNLMKISNEEVFEVVNDSTMLWYKDKNAFRIGYVLIQDPNMVGRGSFASGYKSQAGGKFSTALGYWAQASGDNAFASGNISMATGTNSCAIGSEAYAQGYNSVAVGTSTEASGSSAFAAGNNTEASGVNSCAIGMGCRATGEYGMAFGGGLTLASGYGAVAIGLHAQATADGATAIGTGSVASNSYASAMGRLNEASGSGSTAIGYYNDATGSYSTALGYYTIASNSYSSAFGRNSEASGYNSTAIGYNTTASGYYSTAIGHTTTAQAYGSLVIGRYNNILGTSASWVDGDPIFVIGNGTNSTATSNAFMVRNDGRVVVPNLYTETTTNTKKALYVDSLGKLCVNTAKDENNTSYLDEIEELKNENSRLQSDLDIQKARIAKLEESLEKLLK
jgi:hypothetical protein